MAYSSSKSSSTKGDVLEGGGVSSNVTLISLDLSRLATTLNRLERSIQTGINKWYQSQKDEIFMNDNSQPTTTSHENGNLLSGGITDYPIWEVIQKGNGPVQVSTDRNGQIRVLPPKTAKEILARERERKARTAMLMSIPEDHLAKFHKMNDAKDMWEAIKSRFGGNDESKKMQKYILKQQFKSFSVSNLEELHKCYDRFQSLLSQLEIHSIGVSTEDANQKFLRSLPASCSQVSLIMRTKPGVDTLSFDDLYNNLRVFEYDIKGSTASSFSTQNVAFVSSESTNSTNDVDEFDLEEMDLKWQVAMISIRLKKFYKKTGRRLQFDAKEPVGFDKTKVEYFNCHNTWYFARECRSKGNQESRRRDAENTGYKAKDNGRRPGKQEEPKALVTLNGDGVDWTGHAEDEQENFALMAHNNSGSNTEVTSCSKECDESYAKLKKLYDEQREQLGVASIEIQAYTQALKKVEAALFCPSTKSHLFYEEKIKAVKEKEELKTKLENFQSSSKGLSKLLNSQISTRDKSWLGYGNQIHECVLSYEKEVLESVFDSRSSDAEDSPVNDRFVKVEGLHAVPPSMTGIYMPSKSDFGIDESKFTYGRKQSKTSESNAKTSDTASYESNSSVETPDFVSKPAVNEPTAVSKSKVWSNAPIIKEYESDSDDEYVIEPSKEQEKPSFAFVNTVKHVKSHRKTVKEQNTYSLIPKADKRDWNGLMSKKLGLGYGFTKKACFVCGSFSHLIRDCDFHEKRLAKQDDPQKALKNKGIVDSRCSRHMTRNKAYLVEYQDYNGSPVAFGGSKGYISGKGPNWLFDLDYLTDSMNYQVVTAENKANKTSGLKEANHSVVKSSEAKNGDEKPNRDTGPKINEQGVCLMVQDLLLPRHDCLGATSTNTVNTVSTPISTASPSNFFSAGGPDLNNNDQDDSQIPALEDIYDNSSDGIFTNVSYDDEGAAADFTTLETTVNVSLIPTSRIHSIHPTNQILGDPKSTFMKQGGQSFVDLKFPNKGLQSVKALYGLHQAPRAWYATLSTFFDKYVAEILKKFDFASMKIASTPIETQKPLTKEEEAADVDVHLYRSMIGSLMYLTASRPDIMFAVYACSKFQVNLKTSHLHAVKRIFRYLKDKTKLGIWYPRVSSFDLEAYSDSDYAGANLERKSTTGSCQFLSRRLISWQCKKQTIKWLLSTIGGRVWLLVDANNYCGQVLWIQNQMLDYGFNFMNTKIYIDNESIVKNPVFHSKTKHIEIMHHFIRDAYEKKLIQVLKIYTDDNVADLLTKAFDVSRFVDEFVLIISALDIHDVGMDNKVKEGKGSEQPTKPQQTPSPTQPSVGDQPNVTESSSRPDNTHSPLSMNFKWHWWEINEDQEVLALETAKDAQAAKILKLKTRIKKLEKKCKPTYGKNYMDTEEAVTEWRQSKETKELNVTHDTEVLEKGGSNKEPVNAKARDKAKLKGVEIKDKKDAERPAISVLTLKPLPIIDPKDKGKWVIEEEPKPVKVKSKDQAVKWTQKEQEKFTVDERAKLLAYYFENRKKYKHAQLNKKTLEEIQVLYIKEQERIVDFVPIGFERDERMIKKMNKKAAGVHEEKVLDEPDSTKVEVKQEGNKESTRKRPGRRLQMKATKKSRMQKTDSDLEEEEHLKTFLKLVLDEEGIIDYEVLEKRFPIISFESKLYHLDRHGAECIYYRIFRSDESSRWIKTFLECKELASPKKMAFGKDISNPLIVDSLLKTIWLSTHHVIAMKHWLFQSKRLLLSRRMAKDSKKIDKLVSTGMDDPNMTMEENIKLEEEKACRRGQNEYLAIVYNDALTSKSDLLTQPILNPQHIDEFNLKDETSLSECDKEEQNVLNFNDLFPFNVIYPNDSKSDKDNDDDKVDIEHSSRDLSVKPLPDVINTDVGAYATWVK
ncbi:hypothetical protein Tco_0481784 [Tanacetum coccineum]